MRRVASSFAFVLVLAWGQAAGAAVVCVNPGGTGGCFATIQAGVDAAGDGDVVDVAAGTYVGSVVIGPNRTLTLQGAGATNTILQGTAPIIEVRGVDTTATLRGLGVEGDAFDHHLVSVVNPPVSTVIEDCVVTGMNTGAGTAALAVGGSVVIRRTRVQGAQTGMAVSGKVTIEDSVVRGNGYGIMVYRARLRMRRTEVSEGAADGMVLQQSRVSITDSTISGNASPGIYVVDHTNLTVERTTIAENGIGGPSCCGTPVPPEAGGIWVSDGKNRVTLRAVILANDGLDCAIRPEAGKVDVRSQGFNVLLAGPCGKPKDTDVVGSDPLLAALADNGGGSQTHALLPGSPALGLVTKKGRCKEPDQRGVARTFPCDSGAFEAP